MSTLIEDGEDYRQDDEAIFFSFPPGSTRMVNSKTMTFHVPGLFWIFGDLWKLIVIYHNDSQTLNLLEFFFAL